MPPDPELGLESTAFGNNFTNSDRAAQLMDSASTRLFEESRTLFFGVQTNKTSANADKAANLQLPATELADASETAKTVESFARLMGLNKSISQLQSQLQGNQAFQRLTDEVRMNEALQQLSERALPGMPAGNDERADMLTKQLRATMRKQLGVSTDAELPETLRKLQVKVLDIDSMTARVKQNSPNEPAVMEIPAKLLDVNAKQAIVDAYTQALGLSLLDILHDKGNTAVTMESLQPLLNKIAQQAEKIVAEHSLVLANQEQRPISPENAASDRALTLDPKKPLVTAWDGENLIFGGEKFPVNAEMEKLERERNVIVRDLDEQCRKARELADSTKKTEDISRAKSLETQLANARQNMHVVAELRVALSGHQGQNAQERARGLVKIAADWTIDEHMKQGIASLNRATAIAVFLKNLVSLLVRSHPSSADSYIGRFST